MTPNTVTTTDNPKAGNSVTTPLTPIEVKPAVHKKKRGLTMKQKRFIKALPVAKSATEAAVMAGYSVNSARAIATENLAKPAIRQAIERSLEKVGLTDEYLGSAIKTIVDKGMENNPTASDALRGIDMSLRLKDRYPASKTLSASLNVRASLRAKNVDELEEELSRVRARAQELKYIESK